jgi:hypothetical protein
MRKKVKYDGEIKNYEEKYVKIKENKDREIKR